MESDCRASVRIIEACYVARPKSSYNGEKKGPECDTETPLKLAAVCNRFPCGLAQGF
jgi:hypothetical protein